MRRVVVDPGVFVSALIAPDGAPAKILKAFFEGQIDLVVSSKLLGELEGVLGRPRFRPYLSRDEGRRFVALLMDRGIVVADPKVADNYLVALAREGGADVLISGDRHLTRMRQLRPPVLTPREFLALLGS